MVDSQTAKQIVSFCEYVKDETNDILDFMESTELTRQKDKMHNLSDKTKEVMYLENGDELENFSVHFKKNGEVESVHLSSPYIKEIFHLESIERFDCVSINDKKAEILVQTPESTSTIYMDFRKRKIEVY